MNKNVSLHLIFVLIIVLFSLSSYAIADDSLYFESDATINIIPDSVESFDDDLYILSDIELQNDDGLIQDNEEDRKNASLIPIDAKHFPDKSFRNYIMSEFGGEDGKLSNDEISNVKSIYLYNKGITSLKGLELFTNLEELSCDYNKITSINISKNKKLKYIDCSSNRLTSLDVSNCGNLETLYCSSNKLNKLILGKSKLKSLSCSSNKLKSLDVSKCPSLETLSCYGNRLESINLNKSTKLKSLDCTDNALSKLDISKCQSLVEILCQNNELTVLTIGNNKKLETISCYSNNIKSLNVSKCSVLETLTCSSNALIKLTLGNNTRLTSLDCYNNKIKTMNVSKCSSLESLNCSENQLTKLILGNNTKLEELNCSTNKLTDLDLKKCTALYKLSVQNNKIKRITFGKSIDLKTMYAYNNLLSTINISGCPKMINYIKKEPKYDKYDATFTWGDEGIIIDSFTSLTSGEKVLFPSSQDTAISIASFPDEYFRDYVLDYVDKNHNGLLSKKEKNAVSSIQVDSIRDLTGISLFPNLKTLDCSDGSLKSIDISKNTKLTVLKCYDNKLKSIDLKNNKALSKLQCYGNSIATLDITNCPNLIAAFETGCRIDEDDDIISWAKGSISVDLSTRIVSGGTSLYPPEGAVHIDSISFPDEYFREYVEESIDTYPDGFLTKAELLSVKDINFGNREVSNLKGIELFTNLETLDCSDGSLKSIDISNNTKLIVLKCYDNKLKSIDLKNNKALSKLQCSGNSIATLDITNCPNLIAALQATCSIDEYEKTITWGEDALSVDSTTTIVSNGISLYPPQGAIPVDSTSFPDEEFEYYISRDIDTNSDGFLTNVEIEQVKEIDVRLCDISDLKGIELFSNLETLNCSDNRIKELNLSQNTKLVTLDCSDNSIASLEINSCPVLSNLDCYNNNITVLNLTNKPQLEYLNCYNNSISIIDVSGCNALKKLYCAENPINSYDVSKLPNRLFTLALGATWSVSYDDVSCSNDDLVLSFPSKITLYNGPTVIYPIEDEDYDY